MFDLHNKPFAREHIQHKYYALMKKHILWIFLAIAQLSASSQSLYFPPVAGNTWDTISPAVLGWCEDRITPMLDYLESKNTKAFIVLKDGKIVIEKYFGTFTQDSVWYWASAGKTLTAFAVGMAQQEGHLSITDTSSEYLGSWTSCPPAKEDLITIRHQLTMTTGLDDQVADPYCTLQSCLQYKADAGTRWAYHNGPYTMLDKVIQQATGQTLNVYFTQKVKNPTGMSGAFFPSGYNNVFVSTPRSMARFGLLMLNKGNWNGTQILTDTSYFKQMVNTSQTLNPSYGYLWWLNGKTSFMVPGLQTVFNGPLSPHAPDDMYAALGKNGQFINVVPSMNLVFIRMGDAPENNEVPFTFNDSIWQKLNDVICTTTGVADANKESVQAEIYPNPALDVFTVKYALHSFTVSMYDITGKIVMHETPAYDNAKIETDGFVNGMYFLKINGPNGSSVHRLIIKK